MVEPGRRWIDPALRGQSAVAGVATGCFCILSLAGLQTGFLLQMVVLLTGIVLVGFPHGAFDHHLARPILSARLGPTWWAFFLAGYLSLPGLVWEAWIKAPSVTLAGFLAASVLHFGLGDTDDEPSNGRVLRWAKVLTYGSLPVLLPVAVHPTEAAPILAAMGDIGLGEMRYLLATTVWLLPFWLLAFAWVEVTGWRQGSGLMVRLLTIAGFVMLPPLLAFALYFALGHSAKHLLQIMAWHNAQDLRVACRWAARVVLPASIVCAAGLAGLAWISDNSSIDILAQSFKIIGALTFPHMIVTTWLDRPESSASGRIAAISGWPVRQAEKSR